jgi:hypothetical protein
VLNLSARAQVEMEKWLRLNVSSVRLTNIPEAIHNLFAG